MSIEAIEAAYESNEQPAFDLSALVARLGDLAAAAELARHQTAEKLAEFQRSLQHAESATAKYDNALEQGIEQLADPDNGSSNEDRLRGLFEILHTSGNPDWLRVFRDARDYSTRLARERLIWINGRLHTIDVGEDGKAPTVTIGYNHRGNRRGKGNEPPFTLHYAIWTRQGGAEPVQHLVSHSENPVGEDDIKAALNTEYDRLRWAPHGCFDARKAERLESLAEGYRALGLPDRAASCRELLDTVNRHRPRPIKTA